VAGARDRQRRKKAVAAPAKTSAVPKTAGARDRQRKKNR
jgi:hypothetical protein